jgi:hypothetical protein
MRNISSRVLMVVVLASVVGVGVVTEPADAYCDPSYHTCQINYSDYTVPGWYPAAEAVAVYAGTAAYTYLFARFVRVKPPWYVTSGAGGLWAAISASYITGKLIPGDRIVQRNYEGATYFQSTFTQYRNGVQIAYRSGGIYKSRCSSINNFTRALLNGSTSISPGTRYTFYCP